MKLTLDSLNESCDYQSCNSGDKENDDSDSDEYEDEDPDELLNKTKVINGVSFGHNYNTRYKKRMFTEAKQS